MRLFSYISFILLALNTNLYGQNANDCKKELSAINSVMGNMDFPRDDQVYYLKYSTKSMMWDETITPAKDIEIEILMSKDQLHYLAGDIVMFQDMRDAFMIIKSRKMIMWSTSAIYEDRQAKMEDLVVFRDTLLELCTIKSCDKVSLDGVELKKIILQPNERARKYLKLEKMEVLYNPEKKWINKVVIDYTRKHEMKKTTVTYDEMNYDFKAKMNKPVMDLIFARNNQLRSVYNGYQLIDNR